MGTFTVDDRPIDIGAAASVLDAARAASVYIPTLCSHPDLPVARGGLPGAAVFRGPSRVTTASHDPFGGCELCLVEVNGSLVHACDTAPRNGLQVRTDSARVRQARQESLARILAAHPHACLMCQHRDGCDRQQCSLDVPVNERCCGRFPRCELRKVSDYVGIKADTPRFVYADLPVLRDEPLFMRNFNLCIGCTRCVRMCRDVRGIGALGFVNNGGRTVVGTRAATLGESACHECTSCVEVCPTGALVDKKPVVRGRTVAPLVTSGDRAHALVPCRAACPAMTDVPRYIRLIAQGRYGEATAVVRERVPFPAVLGHVCLHPCEDACRRGELNDPIAICALKRFAAEQDYGRWKQLLPQPSPTGKRVAVVGSGPAGLTAAYFLARRGHAVTVYEAADEPGGMMRYGIPRYRLPREVLDREIEEIVAQGVEIRTGTRVTDVADLRVHSDALFVASGATLSKRIPLDGSDKKGVLWGIEFLKEAASSGYHRRPSLGRVVVVGGGNVAVDVAMTARRMGATEVQMACLESREDMPVFESEVALAVAEQIALHTSWGPKRITGNGRVTGIELKRCTAVFDADGRFNPSFEESATATLQCDTVILAIGQSADLRFIDGVLETARGLVKADEALATSAPGIFAGGDVVAGASSVVDAIAHGRRAAAEIDKYLGGSGQIDQRLTGAGFPRPRLGRDDGFTGWRRRPAPAQPPAQRVRNFNVIEVSYDQADARREASRCLQCDVRLTISKPMMPPEA